MKVIKQCFVIMLMVFALSVYAEPQEVFYAPFDKDFSATVNGKIMQGQHTQQVLFESIGALLPPGVSGKAALIGRPENNLSSHYGITYKGTDIISPKQGSVSFWIAPQDWKASDKNFHIF
ncbi:MAG: hypothetical protein ACYC4Q_09620, partial [Victivallaceae bacterium]